MRKSLLFLAAAALSTAAFAQEIPTGDVCIQSVTHPTYWFNQGWSWGTQVALKTQPKVYTITANGDGTYKLSSTTGCIKDDGGLWADGNDGNAASFKVTKSGENYILSSKDNFVALDVFANFRTDDPAELNGWVYQKPYIGTDVWTIKTDATAKEEWKIYSVDQMKKNFADATEQNPMEASFLIAAANIDINDKANDTAWKYTVGGENKGMVYPDAGWFEDEGPKPDEWQTKATYAWFENDNKGAEIVVEQAVEGCPEGNYTAIYRVVTQSCNPVKIFFNDSEGEVPAIKEKDLWYRSSFEGMADDANMKSCNFKVGADGKLSIKMTQQGLADNQNRFAFKNFDLLYKGNGSSGIEGVGINTVDADAPAEYYNMQGIRVAEPTTGLYIVRQGNKVSKQLIRK